MRIVDAYPATALSAFGARTTVMIEVEASASATASAAGTARTARLTVEVLDRGAVVSVDSVVVRLPAGTSEHAVAVRMPARDGAARSGARGHEVRVRLEANASGPAPAPGLTPAPGDPHDFIYTAVLSADHWRDVPRYGFLSEFAPESGDAQTAGAERVKQLAKLHITVVQFYDWMYRHYQLLPPTDTFRDALDRELSLTTVKHRIAACHDRGMAALAYGAVYGPEPEFILAKPEWLLYDASGAPINLIELFYITDLRAGGGWREHIIGEFEQTVEQLGFDGVHLDQYGFPKLAYDQQGNLVDLSVEFPGLINEAASRLSAIRSEVGVIFNAVNDWPIDTVAGSDQACVYIEVWGPHDSYGDLVELVRRARDLSGKQVILSAYLQPFREGGEAAEWALRYATAVIAAAGGHHLVLGEGNAVLREAYYPNHGKLSEQGMAVTRRYFDHTAAYTHYLHALDLRPVAKTFATGVNSAFAVSGAPLTTSPLAGSLYFACHQRAGQFVVNLVNLTGLTSDHWDVAQAAARPLTGLVLECEPFIRPTRITWASPDDASNRGTSDLTWTMEDSGRVYVELPLLELWATIVIDFA